MSELLPAKCESMVTQSKMADVHVTFVWIEHLSNNEDLTFLEVTFKCILVQSNLDYPDLDYPDFSTIWTFFSGPNLVVNIY